MYDDDEEDLALLQQYEREGADSSNEDLDSDLEDKIMSAVQYKTDSTSQYKQSQQRSNSMHGQLATQSTIPPVTMAQPTIDARQPDFSTDDDSSVSSFNGDGSNIETNDPIDNTDESNLDAPPIIRHIDLNITDLDLQQNDDTDDEEVVLNHELQELIDQQIQYRKNRQQSFRKTKYVPFCFSCLSPGHIQRDCSLCSDCGGERHPSSTCPGVYYCYKCKERGHYAMDCPNKRCFDSCQHCGEESHASDWCPKLVHVYKNQVTPTQKADRYCYNCGGKGHYGDECATLSESSQSQQSVFSFNSLLTSEGSRHRYRTSSSHSSKRPRHDSRHDSSREFQHHHHHHTTNHRHFSDNSDSDGDRPTKKNNRDTRKKEKNAKRPHEHSKHKHGKKQQEIERGSGNSNWKALTQTSSSKTKPGYTNNNNSSSNRIETDFPRNLPKPSFSGVINPETAPRRPKYNGGYSRF